MPTRFQELRMFIRACLLDSDKSCFTYSDDALDSQIKLTTLLLNDEAYASTAEIFSRDLTNQQKSIVTLESAVRILSGLPDDFLWKSPVLTVSRKGMKLRLLILLEEYLDHAKNGANVFAITVDSDFDAMVQSADRFMASLNHALTAWNGS